MDMPYPYLDHLNYIEDMAAPRRTVRIPRPKWSIVWRHCGRAWEERSVHRSRDMSTFCPKCGQKIHGIVTKLFSEISR